MRLPSDARPGGNQPADYNRYVFRNGKLLGEFERLYRECSVAPWHQDQAVTSWWADVAVRLIELRAPYGRAIDVGCGLGYFTNKFSHLCRTTTGVDVSPTAVAKACAMFPNLKFQALDIREPLGRFPHFDLVVVKEILWYVFPQIDQIVANLRALTAENGTLFICQSFPNLQRPFIGKEVISDPEQLLKRFEDSFVLERTCRCQEYFNGQDGPLFMALLRKRTRRGKR